MAMNGFMLELLVHKPEVRVYVNGATDPSLVVNELSQREDGSVGLWCNGYGMIANLKFEQAK